MVCHGGADASFACSVCPAFRPSHILAIWANLAYTSVMLTLTEIEEQALSLTDVQRAVLAAHLLDSLPAILHDEDAGIAEAARRDAELDRDPSAGMTLAEFKSAFGH